MSHCVLVHSLQNISKSITMSTLQWKCIIFWPLVFIFPTSFPTAFVIIEPRSWTVIFTILHIHLHGRLEIGICEIVLLIDRNFRLFMRSVLTSRPQDGATPLFTAAQNNHTAVVEVLIKHGGKVDLANDVSSFRVEYSITALQAICTCSCIQY